MTVLNIYALDDTETENITSLGEGKHVLGRGGIPHVTDKRVSRKHAIIEVTNNKVTLRAVHVNPCFFKTVNDRTLTIITQNQEIELNDGDQFALLPESYWFEVKIQKENLEEPHINGKQSQNTNFEDNLASGSKKGRWSTNTDESIPTTSNISGENNHINETSLSKEDEQTDKTNNLEPTPTTSNIKHESLENNDTNETSLSKEDEEMNKTNNEVSNIDEPIPTTSNINDENNYTSETSLSKEDDQTNNLEPIPTTSNIKYESLENDDTNETSLSMEDEEMNKTNNEESMTSLHFQETQKIEDIETEDNNNDNTTADDTVIKEEDIVQDANTSQPAVKVEPNDNASCSGAQNTVKRERCLYGAKCFRKNLIHRAFFSHPGDRDYKSDADDHRPHCPHGMPCYKCNLKNLTLPKT